MTDKKLSCLIIDDEQLALDLMRVYLSKHPELEIVAECLNGRQAIDQIHEHDPDLIFIDIQMPGLSGFDVIESLQADLMPLVVFVTAFDQYAVRAFDVHAVDYLLKPLDPMKLARAIERCIERLQTGDDAMSKSRLIGAMQDARHNQESDQPDQSADVDEEPAQYSKIVVRDRNAITLIEQDDIDWVDAAGDYMCIHAQGVTHIMRSTLKSLLKELDPRIFKQVHRSTIVNLNRIERAIPLSKGEFFLELGAQDKIKVSRNYRKVIKDFLDNIPTGGADDSSRKP